MEARKWLFIGICIILSIASCTTPANREENVLSFSILKPTGQFPVGITHFEIKRSLGKNRTKTVPVQLWYPANPKGNEKLSPYNTPEALTLMKQVTIEQHKIPESQLVNMTSATNNSYLNAPVPKHEMYPLVIFSPRHYTPPQSYTALLEEFASHGYIVLSVSQAKFPPVEEELTMESTKFHQIWEDNLIALIQQRSQLKKTIPVLEQADQDKIGLLGHSFGGSTSLQVCEENIQCKCAVNIDGYLHAKKPPIQLHKPSLALMASRDMASASPEDKRMNFELISLFKKSGALVDYIEIDKMNHFSFTDSWLLVPYFSKKEGTISGEVGISITRKILLWFFDNHLKGKNRKFPKFKSAIAKKY